MNIYIVPSCIISNVGAVSNSERFTQNIRTYSSIREKDKNSLIISADASREQLSSEQINIIQSNVDFFLDLSQDDVSKKINSISNIHIVKGLGEGYLIYRSILELKKQISFNDQSGRMFKIGGRCFFESDFDISRFDGYYGKYIFKSRKSWKGPNQYLIDTRFYSWCFSLIDEYMEILTEKNPKLILSGIDAEHSHFINIPKNKLIEFEKLNVGCYVAFNGQYVSD